MSCSVLSSKVTTPVTRTCIHLSLLKLLS